MSQKTYCGLDKDHYGGMTPIGNIIKDAWLFGLLPDDEQCEGWTHDRIQVIYDKTKTEWDKYGHLVSNLPDDLRQKHHDIHSKAIKIAKERGWDPELPEED